MDRKALKSIGEMMQPLLQPSSNRLSSRQGETPLPENLTMEQWKVTLVNTLKYLKKIGEHKKVGRNLRQEKKTKKIPTQDFLKHKFISIFLSK